MVGMERWFEVGRIRVIKEDEVEVGTAGGGVGVVIGDTGAMTTISEGAIGDIDLGQGIERGIRGGDHAHEATKDGEVMIDIRGNGGRGATHRHAEGGTIREIRVTEITIDGDEILPNFLPSERKPRHQHTSPEKIHKYTRTRIAPPASTN